MSGLDNLRAKFRLLGLFDRIVRFFRLIRVIILGQAFASVFDLIAFSKRSLLSLS